MLLRDRKDRPLIIAHRGYHLKERENTLRAFNAALDLGVDAVELDVWQTADGALVVYHNPALDTNAPWLPPEDEKGHELIREMAYRKVVDGCRDKGFEPALLEHVLECCRGRAAVDIEIKYPGFEGELVDLVTGLGMEGQVVFSSFYDEVLVKLKELNPEVPRGLILGVPDASTRLRLSELWPQRRAERCGATAVIPNWRLLRPGYVRSTHRKGREVWAWTCNDEEGIRRMIRRGLDCIITDQPGMAMRIKEEGNK